MYGLESGSKVCKLIITCHGEFRFMTQFPINTIQKSFMFPFSPALPAGKSQYLLHKYSDTQCSSLVALSL